MERALIILSSLSMAFAQLTGPLPGFSADMDYFCYYGTFGPTEVWQAQYFDMFIMEPNQISAEQVLDIRNGFDDIIGTDDDVLVFGYVSVGETYNVTEVGDGSGPVYFNGSDTVHQNAGLASYFLDDADHDGEPDMNDIWDSYYVNAGDPNWWAFNQARLDETLYDKGCDGLFMDTMGVPFPASWGGAYEWTTEGMANYVAYLRAEYPEKYLFGNNPSFYMHPALPGYAYRDLIRNSMNAYMYESYYLTWEWDLEIGYVSPWFEGARDTWAPLINAEAVKSDGFTCVALDYVNVEQADYESLLANQIQFTEIDLGWMTAVSSIALNEIRYDTYHNHPVDNNSPTWPGMPGIQYYEVNGTDITLYWNQAADQTLPISYHLYFGTEAPVYDGNTSFDIVVPEVSENFDFEYTITNIVTNTDYIAVLRASDGSIPAHLDQNRRVLSISTDPNNIDALIVDGLFNDWTNIENIAEAESIGDAPLAACDLQDIWIAANGDALHFSCSFSETPMLNSYFYHVFLDTDENTVTGFHYADAQLGADYMVENLSLYHYTGSNNSWSWEWVGEVTMAMGMIDQTRFEASVALADLQLAGNTLSLLFNVNDNAELGPDDFAPNDYTTNSYTYTLEPSSVAEPMLPQSLVLSAYPNPFNSSVTFEIAHYNGAGEFTQIQIYDLQGKLVQQFDIELGHSSTVQWDGLDMHHRSIESGIYIYRLKESKTREGQNFSSGKLLALN